MKNILLLCFILILFFLTGCSLDKIEENIITLTNPTVEVNPPSGTYNNPINIIFSSKTKNLTYYYTLDGSEPSLKSKKYSSSFIITSSAILKVRGYIENEAITRTKTVEYKFKVGGFNITPESGEFTSDQISISIIPITEGCNIIYTTDGSTPSRTNGNIYTNSITIKQFTVLKVFAYKDGYEDSDLYRYAYSFKTLAPEIEPIDLHLPFPFLITMKNQTPNSFIYYTLEDDKWPSSNSYLYTDAGIILTPQTGKDTITLRAIAYRYGFSYSATIEKKYFFKIEDIGIIPEPDGKIFNTPQQVELFCPVFNANIYYTLDDSTPDSTKTLYTGAITISNDTVVKAVAIRDGMKDSNILVKRFIFNKVQKPYFSYASGFYNSPIGVTLSCATVGSEIRYTTNGSEPTIFSSLYTGTPITISINTILKAKAFKIGMTDSDTAINDYRIVPGLIKVSDPTVDIIGGSYTEPKVITVSCPMSESKIFWAIDATPDIFSEQYFIENGQIEIFKSCTLRLISYKDGMANSNIVSENYIIGSYQVLSPEISIPSGTYKDIQVIEISHLDPEVVIRYTVDNSEPTATSKIYGGPFVLNGISDNITLKAKAFKIDCIDSETVSESYSFQLPDVSFNPIGGEYGYQVNLYLVQPVTGSTIRYTTDGTDPTPSYGTIYTGIPIAVTNGMTVKAISYKTGWLNSSVVSHTYTLKVNPPVFSPNPNRIYTGEKQIMIDVIPKGPTIKYTTDDTDPKSSPTAQIYTGPIIINSSTKFRAYAYKSGWVDSDESVAQYTFE